MSKYRVQVSLDIYDENLFENLIKKLKVQKSLGSTLVRLLTSYYYNPEVSDLVDGVSDLKQSGYKSETHLELEKIIESINTSSQVLDMLLEESNLTITEGMQKVSDFASVFKSGKKDSDEVDLFNSVPLLSMSDLRNLDLKAETEVKRVAREKDIQTSERLDSIQKDVNDLKDMFAKFLSLGLNAPQNTSVNSAQYQGQPAYSQGVPAQQGSPAKSQDQPAHSQVGVNTADSSEYVGETKLRSVAEVSSEDAEINRDFLHDSSESSIDSVGLSDTEQRSLFESLLSSDSIGGFD